MINSHQPRVAFMGVAFFSPTLMKVDTRNLLKDDQLLAEATRQKTVSTQRNLHQAMIAEIANTVPLLKPSIPNKPAQRSHTEAPVSARTVGIFNSRTARSAVQPKPFQKEAENVNVVVPITTPKLGG